jgi:putative DNA methylase
MQKAFIETQFPIARLSAESYRERKAVSGQTLTGLGKWWGRKPLILVRACILGMLMPASDNATKDREVFLKILTMDDDGAWQRQKGEIPIKAWREAASPEIQVKYFGSRGFQRGISDEEKEFILAEIWEELSELQRQALDQQKKRLVSDRNKFDSIPYLTRIANCERPENSKGPSPEAWQDINAHLGTTAQNLPELVNQLGQRVFGRQPIVGDAFSGGGSIPFEAGRLGCKAFGSDLNPVAGVLTWASLNILGGEKKLAEKLADYLSKAIKKTQDKITEWGIEKNAQGDLAEAYLYCLEAKPDGCQYFIPLAPNWIVDEYMRMIVEWELDEDGQYLVPKVRQASTQELSEFRNGRGATVVGNRIVDPFNPSRSWSIEALRGPEGMRHWGKDEYIFRRDENFRERLYCIRWTNSRGDHLYATPDSDDLEREEMVLSILKENFDRWQKNGLIPSNSIPENGDKTDEPIRTRGWTYWHHLFAPRQLITHAALLESLATDDKAEAVYAMLNIGRVVDRNSRLCRWLTSKTQISGSKDTFYNQALNPLYNYSTRPLAALESAFISLNKHEALPETGSVLVTDARDLDHECDIWITDPPYADAINYHELADFFLAWYGKFLATAFPDWVPDSRASLAVRGDGIDFRKSMVEIYTNLAKHMPENGMQLVMFTHQNPGVWADLGMILWAAGLRASAAWTISTETESAGIKKGNYVQGTVCLILRKRSACEPGFLFDIYPLVEDEVRNQIRSMQDLDEHGEPNFNDSDYQLAAYAAALKILTQYSSLDGKDVANEVFAIRGKNEKSDFEQVIERAITIACDALIPKGLNDSWRDLNLIERYYLRAVDIESRGERRKGMYEELARGFGVTDIKPLLKSDKANGTRVHTPSGFGTSLLAPIDGAVATTAALPRRGRASSSGPHPFAATPLRHLLFAVCETAAADNDPNQGRQYLRDTFGQTYWGRREAMVRLLDWLAALGNSEDTADWAKDSEAARILAGRLRNDDA